MKNRFFAATIVIVAFLSLCCIAGSAQAGQRLGGGIHYLRTLGDIKDNSEWNPDAIGFLGSYQLTFPMLKIEGDLEWVPDYGGSGKTMFQPQAWVMVGNLIYVSGGMGMGYIDGDWLDNPFYGLRLGADLSLMGLNVDAFTTYRFQSSEVFEDIDQKDLDALTFGVIVRLEL